MLKAQTLTFRSDTHEIEVQLKKAEFPLAKRDTYHTFGSQILLIDTVDI